MGVHPLGEKRPRGGQARDGNSTSKGTEAGRDGPTFEMKTGKAGSPCGRPLPPLPHVWSLSVGPTTPEAAHGCPGVSTPGRALTPDKWKMAGILGPWGGVTRSRVSSHFPEVPRETEPQVLGMMPARKSTLYWSTPPECPIWNPAVSSGSACWGTQPNASSYVGASQTA